MKFAHLPDCHLGSWNNHPELKELTLRAFSSVIDKCIQEKVDFILLPGDLFDTSIPPIDVLRRAVASLRKARKAGIRIYAIAGSHDFSPTGKTMISVLESADLLKDVAKFDEGEKIRLKTFHDESGANISGIYARKGALEHELFERIEVSPTPFSIFMFHSAIEEIRPQHMKDMASLPIASLPQGFDYYATGHVHERAEARKGKAPIIFPGVLFPNNFKELEKYQESGFYLFDNGRIEWKGEKLCEVLPIKLNADSKSPQEVKKEIMEKLDQELKDKIVLLRVSGSLREGKATDIDFRSIFSLAQEKGVKTIKKNIAALTTKEMELSQSKAGSIEEIETEMINSCSNAEAALESVTIFSQEKGEGETLRAYEDRIKNEMKDLLCL